jgi:hypothetical protein
METVKLPREVVEALNNSKHMGVVGIMGMLARWGENPNATVQLCIIHDYYMKNPYMIAQALVNGYEVEETPEDEVREYYEALKRKSLNETKGEVTYSLEIYALMKTLSLLNIQIKGVND